MYYTLEIAYTKAGGEIRTATTPEVRGSAAAASLARSIYRACKSASLGVSILRRDRQGFGRMLGPAELKSKQG
jgi:hypothetical protein